MLQATRRRHASYSLGLAALMVVSPLVSFAQVPAAGSPAVTEVAPSGRQNAQPDQQRGPITGLLPNLGQDLRHLPSRENAIWLTVASIASLGGHRGDRVTTAALSASSALDVTLEAGELLGGTFVQVGGAVATYAVARLIGSRRATSVGGDLIRAQVLNGVLTQTIKLAARRTRPDGGSFSFPSGHASGTFASAAVLHRHFGWKAGAPAYALAGYVAMSRVQESRHFLSDVLFGSAIGMMAGRTVTLGIGEGRFALAPMVTPGGAGIALVSVGGGS